MTHRATALSAVIAAFALIFPAQVQAYLDPGTGSIILQGLLAAIAAGSIAGKLYWRRFVALFRGKSEPGSRIEDAHPDDTRASEREHHD